MTYTRSELLIVTAARMMEDGKTVFVGTGIPMLAAMLAQRLHAPHLVAIFEFGGVGAQLERLPRAVGESRTFFRAVAATGITDIMETAQRGLVDYGFLGGAQIDPFGNLNTSVIGEYTHPRVRLPGPGGGNEVGSLCWKTIILMKHEKRRFVEQVDFVTTPGYLKGPGQREQAGLPPDTGPYRVITDLAMMDFDPDTRRMRVIQLHPGVSREEVMENTGFTLLWADTVVPTSPPTQEELRLLREEIDPEGLYR
ncbi:MAG: 3-oxoacid CoA-transferase [Candidatus Hydrothermae bacterium]|nr:3-oxoacid CoA-transferase [Candidatus Hydrothermae bacterium]